jgi:hypothetical protein
MSLGLRFIALIFLMAASGSAAARPGDRADPGCRDGSPRDRCSPEERRRVRELFGMRSIEEHLTAGDQVRRVFYVDGNGRDLVAIAFVRSPGRDPLVSIHFPRIGGTPAREPFTAPVPRDVWENLLFRSQMFDRTVGPRPEPSDPSGGRIITVCSHSWIYTAESSDPTDPADLRPGSTTTRTEDACAHGLVQFFAIEVQRAALPLLPACAILDPRQHHDEASTIADCAMLHGDRLAAAEVMNRVYALRHARDLADLNKIEGLFDFRGKVDWNGERNGTEFGAQPRFWLTKMGEGGGRTNFYFDRIEGETAYRVRLSGSLVRTIEQGGESEPIRQRARVEQIWIYGPARVFQIESVSVGPFEPEQRR